MAIKENLRVPLVEFMENQITANDPAEVIDAVKLSKPHHNDRYIKNFMALPKKPTVLD